MTILRKITGDVVIAVRLYTLSRLEVRDKFIAIEVRVNMYNDPNRIKLGLILGCFMRFNFSYRMITTN